MAGYTTPTVSASMTAAGTGNGYVTVADNSRFVVGAEAWLAHLGVNTNVIITELLGSSQIGVKPKPGVLNAISGVAGAPATYASYGRMDASSYVVGDTITMPAQFIADAVAPIPPNVALLADTTSAVATLGDTGILDVTNYSSLVIMVTISGGTEGAFTMYLVDDSGLSIQAGAVATPAANTEKAWGLGAANGINGPVPRRVRFTSAAIVAQTTRILVYGRK